MKAIGIVKEDSDMFDKHKNKTGKKIVATQKEDHVVHIADLDDGEFAFMEWLDSEDKTSSKNHIILKGYKNDKECVLDDNTVHSSITVKMDDGVPFCTYCKDDSCAHVGFTICIMQLFERKGILIGEDESVLDLLKD